MGKRDGRKLSGPWNVYGSTTSGLFPKVLKRGCIKQNASFQPHVTIPQRPPKFTAYLVEQQGPTNMNVAKIDCKTAYLFDD